MINFLIRISILFSIFHSGSLFAMIEADAEDVKVSRKAFLISDAPYNKTDKSIGAMTLCFKSSAGSDHAALVFEMFPVKFSDEISMHMIHYSGGTCCWGEKKRPHIESVETTLINAYRGIETNWVTTAQHYRPGEYIRYASWKLPNRDLIKGYLLAQMYIIAHENDPVLYNSYTPISYIQRIMKEVGLGYVDFGWWRETSDNLKILVDQYIIPNPNYTAYEEISLPFIISYITPDTPQ